MGRKLPRMVAILGLVSFFNDLASEMVAPFIPMLIATVLGAGPVMLGLATSWGALLLPRSVDRAGKGIRLWDSPENNREAEFWASKPDDRSGPP